MRFAYLFVLTVEHVLYANAPERKADLLFRNCVISAHGKCAMHEFGALKSVRRRKIRNYIKPNGNCGMHSRPANKPIQPRFM
jgi:hypothetical protein